MRTAPCCARRGEGGATAGWGAKVAAEMAARAAGGDAWRASSAAPNVGAAPTAGAARAAANLPRERLRQVKPPEIQRQKTGGR